MKKLMALCLSLLMVLSMVSFSVMAEETEATPAAVTFEDIANGQPTTFVTSNLVLGANDTITSSNTAVIATDGKVTRPLFEDAKVTISINGGEAVEVTVKAKTVEPLNYSDFTVKNNEKSISDFGATSGWEFSSSAGSTLAENGKVVINIAPNENSTYSTLNLPITLEKNKTMVWLADISDIADNKDGTYVQNSRVDLRLTFRLHDAKGNIIDTVSNGNIYTIDVDSISGYSPIGNNLSIDFKKGTFGFKIDSSTGDIWVSNGTSFVKSKSNLKELGTKVKAGTVDIEDIDYVTISSASFISAATRYGAKFTIDNFVQYEEVPAEEVLANATPAEKSAYYSQYLEADYVANGGNFASLTTNLKFAPEEELIDGVSITWTSTNPAVVAEDGTVTPALGSDKTVTVTGTLKVDGVADVVKSYTVTVSDATISYKSEIVNAENLPADESFVGSTGWSPASLKKWESMTVLQEDNGNRYFRVGSSNYQPNGNIPTYTFSNFPTSVEDGETLVFEFRAKVPVLGGISNLRFLLNENEMAEFIYSTGFFYNNEYSVDGNGYTAGIQTDDYNGPSSNRYNDQKVTADTWYNLRMEITNDSWVKCYIEDKLVGTHKTSSNVPATITSAQFSMKNRGTADSTDASQATITKYFYDVDDIKLYKKANISDYLTLVGDDAAKVAFVKKYIEDNGITASGYNAGIYKNLHLVNPSEDTGVTVTWTSSNTSVITNEGIVTLVNSLHPCDVVMTATINAGDVTETISVPVQVAQNGTTLIGAPFPVIDFDTFTTGSPTPPAGRIGNEEGHGGYLRLNLPEGRTELGFNFWSYAGMVTTDRILISADTKYSRGTNEAVGGRITVRGTTTDEALGVMLDYKNQVVHILTSGTFVSNNASSVDFQKEHWIKYPMSESLIEKEGKWVNVVFDHNALSMTYDVYIDGEKINDAPVLKGNADVAKIDGGWAISQLYLTLVGSGDFCVDNVTIRKFSDTASTEVNAALNAAHLLYGSEVLSSSLANQELKDKTIDKTFVTIITSPASATFNLDTTDLMNNPAGYTFTTSETAPVITYKLDGEEATEIGEIISPKTANLTITATSADDNITESRTMTREFAPIAIRGLALGTDDCLNGVWVEGNKKSAVKLVLAKYLEDRLVNAEIIDFATADINSYDSEIGLVKNLSGYTNPKLTAAYDQIKIFVVDADGITPLAYANAELHD